MQNNVIYESNLTGLELLHRGKVRDIYALDDEHLLIVTSDRISAYDVILPDPIPGKGRVLTQISNFWFDHTTHIVPNHLADFPVDEVLRASGEGGQVSEQAIIVRRLKPLPIEAVVRGYLIGSGWRDYCDTGSVCGIRLPAGLRMAEQLPEPIFTPATKAELGEHDENISFKKMADLIGDELANAVREIATKLYRYAAAYAADRGIIIADTKFEFAPDDDGRLILIDEALTPDSSRFWPKATYRVGTSPPSFDKQYVRDYLDTLDWNKKAPGPHLPSEIIRKTTEKYDEALRRLTAD